ncbi:MAG: ABC transporter permease [Cyclobacteriaceae bacterium]
MFKSYFRISYRQLVKSKTYTIINILGLSIGIAAALLIYEYTSYEKGFDNFHTNLSNIYRVTTVWNKDVTPDDKRATTVPWSGPGAKDVFSEIEDYTRFAPFSTFTGETWISFQNKKFAEERIFLADQGFLKIFSFPWIAGDKTSALSEPFSIVLTETAAKRYFGDENPVGKILTINNTLGNFPQSEFKVTGVISDPPAHSHLQFDFLVSFNSIWPSLFGGSTYWHWDYTYCYLLLNDYADPEALGRKITELRVKQFGFLGSWNDAIDFKLQPLRDIHLFSRLKGELAINGDGLSVYFLMIIGLCILLSAYVNYVNLATVKAVERKTEIGIRKIVGSTKWQLTAQLLVESALLNLIAVLLGVVICLACQPLLMSLTQVKSFNLSSIFLTTETLVWVGVILSAGIFLSSLYPVVMLSSFKPAQVLKGKNVASKSAGIDLRKCLIILQFAFCIGFTISTYALYKQLKYMKGVDMGMDIKQILVVKGFGAQPYSSYENFKSKLQAFPFIKAVGTSSSAPGEEITNLSLRARISIKEDKSLIDKELKVMTVDGDFFKTLDVKFLSGRNFDQTIPSDKDGVIVNEAAAKLLGYQDPRHAANENLSWGRSIMGEGMQSRIIGVIRNYHQLSLKNAHEPLAFIPNITNEWQWNKRYYFIKFEAHATRADFQAVMSSVEKSWKSVVKDEPFNYFFLDQYFDRQYRSDTTFNFLFMLFSMVAIVITCLGLFGLVAYTTLQRTKEIGVRKVLGASVRSILVLLSKDFMRLMVIATVLSVPLIVWSLDQWFSQYAFRIELTLWLFTLPVVLIFLIALFTVMLKSMKVAVTNPAESLRYE